MGIKDIRIKYLEYKYNPQETTMHHINRTYNGGYVGQKMIGGTL